MSLDKPLTWEQVTHIVDTYELDKLGRSPEELSRYRTFKKSLNAQNIGITTNLLKNVLHWIPPETDIHLSDPDAVNLVKYDDARPFANPNDVKITLNDFPYFIANKTDHFVVWIKFPMPPDPNSEIGDIDEKTKGLIEKYIQLTFVQREGIKREHIIWWKNYTIIQSIKSIPHVHVLVNLDDDVDGSKESNLRKLIGTPGVMFDYAETTNSSLQTKL